VSHPHDTHLLEGARHGDRAARDELVTEHLPDVRAIASRYRNLGLPLDDLVQEGAIGLLDAIEHFDDERRTDFEVYARFRIRRAIRNALTDKSRLIRLPKEIVERRRALGRAASRLTTADGVPPSARELAELTGLPVETVRETLDLNPNVVSLDQVVLPDGSTLEELVQDEASPDPVTDVVEREEIELVDRAVGELPERQREIVMRHFGLNREAEEIAQVAAELHLSQQRARTIERDALFTLRDRLERQLPRSGRGAAWFRRR
jgi:RNA polymerase nonessential primary-like sigma factor